MPHSKKAILSPSSEGESIDAIPVGEFGGIEPTEKDMGLVQFTLDKGVRTTVVGTVYGLDFEIENEGYRVRIFFDYYNKRLKVLDYDAENYSALVTRLSWLAEHNQFDKIFLKAHESDFQQFLSHGYLMEGILRYYFQGKDAYILSRFSSEARVTSDHVIEEAQMIEELMCHTEHIERRPLDPTITIRRATPEDIPQLILIYRSVFDTYPSPLTNPDYIKSTMERNVIYRIAFENEQAIAAASAEITDRHSNAEVTDCATTPEAQGKGIMQHLIAALEDDLRERKIRTAYTLARALSIGMNRSFYRLGYEFCGRLINNCDIFGKFEDMNIWVKRLAR